MWCFKPNMSAMCICCEIRRLQLVNCSHPRLQRRWLWNNHRDYDGFELGCSIVPQRGLRLGAQQGSLDRYSYGEANSHKSCVDQGDHWVIKFRLGLNLFDLIKLWTPWRGYGKEGVRWRWNQVLFNCAWMRAHEAWWLFSDLDVFESRGRLLEFVTRIRREGRRNFRSKNGRAQGAVHSTSWLILGIVD